MNSRRRLICLFTLLLPIAIGPTGCSHTAPPVAQISVADLQSKQNEQLQRIVNLTQMLLALDPGVSEYEARRVAQSAIAHAEWLGRSYRIIRPPQLHNLLVKLGWKERGLCYHWTEDLLNHLQELDLLQLHLQRGVAHRGSDLREHHSVIVTSRENAFREGVVLDAWRDSGELFWAPVSKDRYPWVPLNGGVQLGDGADAR